VEPIIDLAPGAEDNPLAVRIAERIRRNLADKPKKMADFRALRGSVLMVAQDTGTSLTMRFDHGRLTLHDGTIGIPSATLCGDEEVLLGLSHVGVSRWLGVPAMIPRASGDRATLWDVGRSMAEGRLTIYGLLVHPRLLLFLLRVLSVHG
jgi:hypothetical protein